MDAQTDDPIINLSGLIGTAITNTITWILLVAVVTAVVFGVISWCVLKKFRTFRNFVLLSLLVAVKLQMLLLWFSERFITEDMAASYPAVKVIMICYYVLFQSTIQYWLLVLCYVFSVDFLQVFHYDIRKKYLWSNLFAWGLPFLTVHLYALVGSVLNNMSNDDTYNAFEDSIAMSLLLIPVVLSFITYLAVIGRLLFGGSTNKCNGFMIATLIFAISNVILFTILPTILQKEILAVDVSGEILEYSLVIALIVLIVVLKSNWKLWKEHLEKTSGPEAGVMLGDLRV